MTTFTGTANADVADVTGAGTLTGFSGGTIAQLQDATGDSITGAGGSDSVIAGSGNDTIAGDAGADTLRGGGGADIFTYLLTGDVSAGEIIDGGSDAGVTDTIQIMVPASVLFGTTFDFSSATITSIERLQLSSTTYVVGNAISNHLFAASQVGSGLSSNLAIVTTGGGGTFGAISELITFNMGTATALDISGFTFDAGWSNTSDLITISGDGDAETIIGSSRSDSISGGGGNDTLDGGITNTDTLAGGAGNDTYIVDLPGDTITELMGEGSDTIRTALAAYTLTTANVENLTGSATGTTTQSLTGNTFDNVITASAASTGNASLYGGAGLDTLTGGSGSDFLDGGTGNDSMAGGGGNDSYVVDSASDVVTELAGGGTADRVIVIAMNYTLLDQFEILAMSIGTGVNGTTYTLHGNEADNQLFGNLNAGTFVLYGEGGNDTLNAAGVFGVDPINILYGGDGADLINGWLVDSLYGGAGNDTITSQGGNDLLDGGLDNDSLDGGADNDTLFGGDGNDTLNGGNDNDTLDGGNGDDSMVGGAGTDVYIVDSVGDIVAEVLGTGSDEVRTMLASYSLAGLTQIGRLTGTAVSGQQLTGNTLFNTITGGAGNDTLDGGIINSDTLVGGAGDDTYIVDTIGGAITELVGEGSDTIRTALAAYTLTAANVENLTGTATGITAQTLTGNALDNVITASAASTGNASLYGGAGLDTLYGGAGNDVRDRRHEHDSLAGGAGNDVFFISANAPPSGVDLVGGGTETDRLRVIATAEVSASNGVLFSEFPRGSNRSRFYRDNNPVNSAPRTFGCMSA